MRYERPIMPAALAMLAGVLAALAGCGDAKIDWSNPFAGATTAPAGGSADSSAEAETEGTTYSVLLREFADPGSHVQDSNYFKDRLSTALGWKDVFVIHRGGYSLLFRGRFRTVDDAQDTLRQARAHRAQDDSAPFSTAIVVPLPGKDIGPPEWNLKKVKGTYTLLVAIFKDDPEQKYYGRKKFAVEYCKRLRAGGYEAYYYHGAAASHVTIGAFPESAVTIRQSATGQEVTFNDLKIVGLQHDFPLLAVNGGGMIINIRGKDGKTVSVPQKTQFIRIPREEGFYGQ